MKLLKYADDTALVGHMTETHTLSQYQEEVNSLVQTFAERSVELNITKSKELCCGPTGKTTGYPG